MDTTPTPLNDAQLAQLERALDQREAELLDAIARARGALAEPPGSQGVEARDSGEDGQQRMNESQELSELDRDERQLGDIAAARLRMREHTYGLCEECGEPIPFARLQAVPTARLCIRHEEELEKSTRR